MAITKHSEESEKSIEQYLVDECRKRDWLCLKFDPPGSKGWPDRIVLPAYGGAFFVEVKSKGKALRPMQSVRFNRLRDGKAHVYVCDSKAKVDIALDIERKCIRNLDDWSNVSKHAGHSWNARTRDGKV